MRTTGRVETVIWQMDGGTKTGHFDLQTIGAPWNIVHDGVLI